MVLFFKKISISIFLLKEFWIFLVCFIFCGFIFNFVTKLVLIKPEAWTLFISNNKPFHKIKEISCYTHREKWSHVFFLLLRNWQTLLSNLNPNHRNVRTFCFVSVSLVGFIWLTLHNFHPWSIVAFYNGVMWWCFIINISSFKIQNVRASCLFIR